MSFWMLKNSFVVLYMLWKSLYDYWSMRPIRISIQENCEWHWVHIEFRVHTRLQTRVLESIAAFASSQAIDRLLHALYCSPAIFFSVGPFGLAIQTLYKAMYFEYHWEYSMSFDIVIGTEIWPHSEQQYLLDQLSDKCKTHPLQWSISIVCLELLIGAKSRYLPGIVLKSVLECPEHSINTTDMIPRTIAH